MDDLKESLYKIIGERIKARREELKINQSELSNKLQLSRSSVSNIEVGRHQVPLFTLFEIAKELDLNIRNLIPDFDEISAFATNNYIDFSLYLNNTNLDTIQKDKLNDYISNI